MTTYCTTWEMEEPSIACSGSLLRKSGKTPQARLLIPDSRWPWYYIGDMIEADRDVAQLGDSARRYIIWESRTLVYTTASVMVAPHWW